VSSGRSDLLERSVLRGDDRSSDVARALWDHVRFKGPDSRVPAIKAAPITPSQLDDGPRWSTSETSRNLHGLD
jgi:hypothetical protein